MPLEKNTVRFLDNFSHGRRGAASAEQFLRNGYLVVYLYRDKSLVPFLRHNDSVFAEFQRNPSFKQKDCVIASIRRVIDEYIEFSSSLLLLTYTDLNEYLHYLQEVSKLLHEAAPKCVLYLAAAVSDFYVPPDQIPDHKIPSNKPLQLELPVVPKLLKPLVKYWAPDAFVVSFKLETNPSELIPKARQALDRYGHKLVIANELESRANKVLLVEPNTVTEVHRAGMADIEEKIVLSLIKRHDQFLTA